MKEPDYVMKLMTTYGTLDPKDKRTRRKFKRGGVMETKYFMYTEVVANHFLYQHQVDDNINRMYAPISIEKFGLPNIGLIVALLGTLTSQK